MTVFYSRAAVRELYVASSYVKHLAVDDAFVGIVGAKLGLELTSLDPFILNYLEGNDIMPHPGPDRIRQLISWHIPNNISMRQAVWTASIEDL